MSSRSLALLLAISLLAGPAGAAERKSKFNWDALGTEFCRLTVAGDLAGLRDLLSDSLAQDIAHAAARNPGLPPARVLFQSYTNEVPVCEAHTRNAAIIAVTRSNPDGAAPAWTEYVEVVPAPDGTTRIDNVLFATRRSDTLRARLEFYAAQ
ncbi:hypothetical protein [uncultured Amaricoccus sp.]|uniref:hypothetical protein n=1 Tax=uncultured Amaricoccus sp. TaxID=339341 RepID=UPI002603A60B|nr:hypothetical protein [uncultured Amaricoccus sp.]